MTLEMKYYINILLLSLLLLLYKCKEKLLSGNPFTYFSIPTQFIKICCNESFFLYALPFLLLFHQTFIIILTKFLLNSKSWRRLLQRKRSTSTSTINSSKFVLFCFSDFLHIYLYIYIYIYSQVHHSAGSLFSLIIIRSGRLAEIKWYFCITKSQRIFRV